MGAVPILRERARLLVLLPQLPDDPASGAARTVTTIAGLMAAADFEVELIATTATEGYLRLTTADALAYLGATAPGGSGIARFERRGVGYSLLVTGDLGIRASVQAFATAYDRIADEALARFRPHLVLTYGGSQIEVERQRRARAAGAKVVFGLYNMRYFTRGFFDHVDAVITPSRFLSDRYRDAINLDSHPLPGPLWPLDVTAERRHPKRLTMVNPTLDKGLMVFIAIAKLLSEEDHRIPIDIFTTRDSADSLRQAAYLGGADLATDSVAVHPGVLSPSRIYEDARVVLVPSLFEDPAPRVVAEAFVNGAVPLGSDRGGIPEMCAQAGFTIPIPRTVDATSFNRVPSAIARPWVDRIVTLFNDGSAWRQAVARGYRAAGDYLPPTTTLAYVRLFQALVKKT